MELLHAFFQKIPMAALFLSVAVGYWIGKIRIGNFSPGGMAGTLLVAVVIGQIGVPVDPVVKDMMFALFIYATGYVRGPLRACWPVPSPSRPASERPVKPCSVWDWKRKSSKSCRPTSALPTPLRTCLEC